MTQILHEIGQSPLLGAVGALLIIGILLAPIVLRLAGLTGQQIVDLLSLTLQFFVNLLREFRAQNTRDE